MVRLVQRLVKKKRLQKKNSNTHDDQSVQHPHNSLVTNVFDRPKHFLLGEDKPILNRPDVRDERTEVLDTRRKAAILSGRSANVESQSGVRDALSGEHVGAGIVRVGSIRRKVVPSRRYLRDEADDGGGRIGGGGVAG